MSNNSSSSGYDRALLADMEENDLGEDALNYENPMYNPSSDNPSVTLTFRDLKLESQQPWQFSCSQLTRSMSATSLFEDADGKQYRLQNVSGYVSSGEILAIMGSSGAGKSTLMDILSGTVRHKSNLISGQCFITKQTDQFSKSGKKMKPTCVIGYVTQEPILMSTQSIEETLWTHAELRFPTQIGKEVKEQHIYRVLKQMGLLEVRDIRVGDHAHKGISGGEKKRLQIAVELLRNPDILFLDEPTSGLDSKTSEKLMDTLRSVADQGVAIVCTIHQPRYSIFYKLDNLLLLTKGMLMYFGPATKAVEYFAEQGYECPQNGNPADFIIDVTTIGAEVMGQEVFVANYTDLDAKSTLFYNSTLGHTLTEKIKVFQQSSQTKIKPTRMRKKPTSVINQTGVLLKRQLTHYSRTPSMVFSRLIESAVVSFLIGGIFWMVEDLHDLLGAIIFSVMWVAFTGMGQISYMVKDRLLANAEITSCLYSIGPYYVVQVTINTLVLFTYDLIFSVIVFYMVGLNGGEQGYSNFLAVLLLIHMAAEASVLFASVISTHSEEAFLMSSVAICVPMLFSGFFRRVNQMPIVLRWLEHVSFVKYALLVSLNSQVKEKVKREATIKSLGYVETGLDLKTMYAILIVFALFWRFMPYPALKIKYLIHRRI